MSKMKKDKGYYEVENYVRGDEKRLREEYGTDYVAFVDGKDVDHDADRFKLRRRVHKDFPEMSTYFLSTIDNIINPKVAEFSSPEFAK